MKNFRNYRMLFLDALPQAGSTGSITLMSELLQVKIFYPKIDLISRLLTNDQF